MVEQQQQGTSDGELESSDAQLTASRIGAMYMHFDDVEGIWRCGSGPEICAALTDLIYVSAETSEDIKTDAQEAVTAFKEALSGLAERASKDAGVGPLEPLFQVNDDGLALLFGVHNHDDERA